MKRRTYLTTMLAGAVVAGVQAADPAHPIQLHVEKAFVDYFVKTFRPTAIKHGAGYIDVKLLKLHSALMGKGPEGVNYRFNLTYQSEELRQKWINSPEHGKVWPVLEGMLSDKNYTVLLFDVN